MKLLFIVEAITLAQIVRLYSLAKVAATAGHVVVFAVNFKNARRWQLDFSTSSDSIAFFDVHTVSHEAYVRSNYWGTPLYTDNDIYNYFESDARLVNLVKPDLIIHDLRLTASTIGTRFDIPVANLINAYWLEASDLMPQIVPDNFAVDWCLQLGLTEENVVAGYRNIYKYIVSSMFNGVHRLRRSLGLAPFGDMFRMLLSGDYLLHPDVPELGFGRSDKSHYIGPIFWSPSIPSTTTQTLEADCYVTMGSSGRNDQLVRLVEQLCEHWPIKRLLVSTAGGLDEATTTINGVDVNYQAMVDGDVACKEARWVVCNGGSTTAYQALKYAKPTLLLPSNVDQYLSTHYLVQRGVASSLRARQIGHSSFGGALNTALQTLMSAETRTSCRHVADAFTHTRCDEKFIEFLNGRSR